MRNFLCNNDITKIKSILFELMLSPKLIMLENLHPEVLKIGKFFDSFTRFIKYGEFLAP